MAALLNIGGALSSTPQSLADAHYWSAVHNVAKTWNPLKLAGVPQTTGQSSPYCEDICRRYCCLINLFLRFLICALVVKIRPNKVVRWCADGEFLAIFWVLYFQRAASSTLQTCILNSHWGHTMCWSTVDIQSATAEIRRGKKKEENRTNYRAKI